MIQRLCTKKNTVKTLDSVGPHFVYEYPCLPCRRFHFSEWWCTFHLYSLGLPISGQCSSCSFKRWSTTNPPDKMATNPPIRFDHCYSTKHCLFYVPRGGPLWTRPWSWSDHPHVVVHTLIFSRRLRRRLSAPSHLVLVSNHLINKRGRGRGRGERAPERTSLQFKWLLIKLITATV